MVGFSHIALMAIGFGIGVIVALALAARFRRPSSADSKTEHAELIDLKTLTLRGLESVAAIEFNRDRHGRTTSVTIRLRGEPDRRVYEEKRFTEEERYPEPPTNLRVEPLEDPGLGGLFRAPHERVDSPKSMGKRESLRDVKMRLTIETDRRVVEKGFSNLHDLKWFMDSFFSSITDRRLGRAKPGYTGPERRRPVQ